MNNSVRPFNGELKSYKFSDRDYNETKPGEYCYFVATFKVDGARKQVVQQFFIGSNEDYEISDDGKSLTMTDGESVTFGFTTPFGCFMDSLVEKGFPESELPDREAGDALELSAIVGKRFRFKQEVDEEATRKSGQRVWNTVVDAVLDAGSGRLLIPRAELMAAMANENREAPEEPLSPMEKMEDRVRLALQEIARENETSELEEAIVALLNVAVPDLTCVMCGQDVEDHADGCPIWGLEQWINPSS